MSLLQSHAGKLTRFAYPKRGANESVWPLRTTRKCNASMHRLIEEVTELEWKRFD